MSSSPVRIFPPIWNVIGRYSDISRVALPLDFSETPELRLPAKESSNKRKIGWAIAVCVAASLLLFLVNQLFMGTEEVINPYEGSYIVRNGCVVTDLDRIQPEIEAIYQAAEAAEKEADLLYAIRMNGNSYPEWRTGK